MIKKVIKILLEKKQELEESNFNSNKINSCCSYSKAVNKYPHLFNKKGEF